MNTKIEATGHNERKFEMIISNIAPERKGIERMTARTLQSLFSRAIFFSFYTFKDIPSHQMIGSENMFEKAMLKTH